MPALYKALPLTFTLVTLMIFNQVFGTSADGSILSVFNLWEGINGLAFMLAFGLGAPAWLSLTLSAAFLLLVCIAGYKLGVKAQIMFRV
ncbi:hypothetical protein L2750_19420 [Shewanella submarina]|uniref:Uncharacterized protein n=1 Tax=Shewanella submarina TaxID=2016376 RepID=A0ABV7G923_9GAMM|nr:hypothetical protein [Shewanella submarina]MCL1039295.1 hypothetical protein [Shewanella submarina]